MKLLASMSTCTCGTQVPRHTRALGHKLTHAFASTTRTNPVTQTPAIGHLPALPELIPLTVLGSDSNSKTHISNPDFGAILKKRTLQRWLDCRGGGTTRAQPLQPYYLTTSLPYYLDCRGGGTTRALPLPRRSQRVPS